MGRVAAVGDNAAMEALFSLLQKNVLDQRRWKSRSELHYEVVTWIERSYDQDSVIDSALAQRGVRVIKWTSACATVCTVASA